jgi:RNA polymerase sigma-70 factor, ECF subfamily
MQLSLNTVSNSGATSAMGLPAFGFEVFGIEFDSHRTAMLRFAKRKVRDEMLAEDAVQDIFRKETRYIRIGDVSSSSHDEDSNFDEASTFDAISQGDHGLDPMRALGSKRMGSRLAEAIDGLPDTLRQVVQLHLIEGLSTAEVCEQLGISEANCWVRIHRARKKLAIAMADHVEPQHLS